MRLLVIFGPPAVGKMAVGRVIAERSTFRLFHNHASIEPVLDVFDYGTPPFRRVLTEFRERVVEEAAANDVDLVLTYVWGLDLREDLDEVRRQIRPYCDADASIFFAELAADLSTRIERNRSELRLTEKRSKRDVEWSEANVRQMQERFVMNTTGTTADAKLRAMELLALHPHRRLDNTALSAEDAANAILTWIDDV